MFKNNSSNRNFVSKELYRINFRIRVSEVRLIENEQNLGIYKIQDALLRAENLGVDLIEIAPLAKPPVCLLMDYGKFKYDQKQREKEKNKKQKHQELKELVFSPVIDTHDIEVKVKAMRRFLEDDKKVQIIIKFKGRLLAHKEKGLELIARIQELVSDIAKAEKSPQFNDKSIISVFSPKLKDSNESQQSV